MRRLILATYVVGFCVWGCSRPTVEPVADSGPAGEEVAGTPYGDLVIGDPISHENLTIFPISSKTPKNDDRFITLDEGLAAGTVKIIEIGAEDGDVNNADDADPFGAQPQPAPSQAAPQSPDDGNAVDPFQVDGVETDAEDPFESAPQEAAEQAADGTREEIVEGIDEIVVDEEVDGDVNRLMVLNTSGKPLYLMPGEVISGGKQDRTIGQEIVIDSSEKPVPIDVFCVEHGRWAGRSVANTTAQLASFEGNLSLVISQTEDVEELAKEAQRGKFVASVGQLNKDVRLAVQQAGGQGLGQDRVWEEVAKTNSKVGNDSDSGNFTENYVSGEVAKDLEPFIQKLKPTGETKQIVGVAVAVNGKMLSVDIFESTPLFKKFWPKLLKSYALDAVAATSEEESQEKPKAIEVHDCIAFLKDAEKSIAKTEELADGQKITRRASDGAVSFSYYDAEASRRDAQAPFVISLIPVLDEDGPPPKAAGIGGGVHTSVFAR